MRNYYSLALSLILGSALLAAPLIVQAGGTIKGKVTFSGKVPPPKKFALEKFPNSPFCSKNPSVQNVKIVEKMVEIEGKGGKKKVKQTVATGDRLLKEVEVDANKGLKNAVVSVRGIKDLEWMKGYKRTEVIAKLCEFLPYTGVVISMSKSLKKKGVKAKFYVENTDADPDDPKSKEGVLHNPHGFDVLGAKSKTLFNIGLARKGDTMEKPLKMKFARKGSVMRLQCDQHEFMQGWFLLVTNPHYTVVNTDGTFEIKDVPAGKHKVLVWHPVVAKNVVKKAIEIEVDVKDGATVEANFDIKKK